MQRSDSFCIYTLSPPKTRKGDPKIIAKTVCGVGWSEGGEWSEGKGYLNSSALSNLRGAHKLSVDFMPWM